MLAAAAPDADKGGLAAQNAVAPTVGADDAAPLPSFAEELRIRELAVTGSARPLLPAVTSSPMLGVRTSPGERESCCASVGLHRVTTRTRRGTAACSDFGSMCMPAQSPYCAAAWRRGTSQRSAACHSTRRAGRAESDRRGVYGLAPAVASKHKCQSINYGDNGGERTDGAAGTKPCTRNSVENVSRTVIAWHDFENVAQL